MNCSLVAPGGPNIEAQSILTLVKPRGSPSDSPNPQAALSRPAGGSPAPNSAPAAVTAAYSTHRPQLTPNCEIQHCTQTSSA